MKLTNEQLVIYFAVVICIILGIWGLVTAIDAIINFFSTHMWLLWLIIALLIAIPVIFFTRHYIVIGFNRLFMILKNDTTDNKILPNNNQPPNPNEKHK